MTEYTKEQCEEYAKDNLKACAKEILEWKHTAILSDGHLRELACRVSDWAGHTHDLQIAESLVVNAALEEVAQ